MVNVPAYTLWITYGLRAAPNITTGFTPFALCTATIHCRLAAACQLPAGGCTCRPRGLTTDYRLRHAPRTRGYRFLDCWDGSVLDHRTLPMDKPPVTALTLTTCLQLIHRVSSSDGALLRTYRVMDGTAVHNGCQQNLPHNVAFTTWLVTAANR